MAQRQAENRIALEFWIKIFGGSVIVFAAIAAFPGYRNIGHIETRLSVRITSAEITLRDDIDLVSEELETTARSVFDEREEELMNEVRKLERFMQVRDLTERVNTLDREPQVSDSEVQTVMRQIEEFAEDIRSGRSPEALNAVGIFAKVLYQSGQVNL